MTTKITDPTKIGTGMGMAANDPLDVEDENWVQITSEYYYNYVRHIAQNNNNNNSNNGAHWYTASLLHHELGHALGLGHNYVSWQCGTPASKGTTNNVMDYHPSCQCSYTKCQLGIMHANIMGVASSNSYVPSSTKVPNFVVEEWCNLDNTKDITITASTTWNDKKYLAGDIYINNGVILTVKCSLALAEGARIIVQRGGKLVVDGGTITNICGKLWQGIIVHGNRIEDQMHADQGIVELKNNATLTNARVAVRLGDGWLDNGSIIEAVGANFINNRKNVEFLSYTDPNDPDKNQSIIKNCLLECTSALQGETVGTGEYISLWDVHGVKIVGNTFRNSAPPSAFSNNSRGVGIYSIDADYYLGRSADPGSFQGTTLCSFDPATSKINKFDGLSTGVEYIWQAGTANPIGLIALENEFKNITRGIICNGENKSFLYKNKFIWDNQFIKDPNFGVAPTFITIPFGIRMETSTSFTISDNAMEWHRITQPTDYTPEVLGLHVINSFPSPAPTPVVNRNTMKNFAPYPNREYVIGNKFEGNNNSLDVEGNTYDDLSIDWFVQPNAFGSLRSPQGAPCIGSTCYGAANKFTDCAANPSSINFYIMPGAILDYFGNNQGNPPPTCNTGSINYISSPDKNKSVLFPSACVYDNIIGQQTAKPIVVNRNGANKQYHEQLNSDANAFLLAGELTLAPNPAASLVTINYKCANLPNAAQLQITDALGRQVKQLQIQEISGSVTLPVAELGTGGIYYILLQEDGRVTKTAKLITQ